MNPSCKLLLQILKYKSDLFVSQTMPYLFTVNLLIVFTSSGALGAPHSTSSFQRSTVDNTSLPLPVPRNETRILADRLKIQNETADCTGESDQLYVDLSPFWYTFMALITAIGLLVSLISNMIIIYLFACTPSLRNNPSNIVAVNLSLSDLLYCIQWPTVIYCSITQTTWLLESEIVCQFFGYITLSTALASILTVLLMSIERVLVISNPIKAKHRFTNRTAHLVTLIIWFVALTTALPPLFGKFNRYTLDPSKTSCTLDYLSHKTNYKLYILVLYVMYWIVPAIMITICYLLIIEAFKRSSVSLREASKGSSNDAMLLRKSGVEQSSNSLRSQAASLPMPSMDHSLSLDDSNEPSESSFVPAEVSRANRASTMLASQARSNPPNKWLVVLDAERMNDDATPDGNNVAIKDPAQLERRASNIDPTKSSSRLSRLSSGQHPNENDEPSGHTNEYNYDGQVSEAHQLRRQTSSRDELDEARRRTDCAADADITLSAGRYLSAGDVGVNNRAAPNEALQMCAESAHFRRHRKNGSVSTRCAVMRASADIDSSHNAQVFGVASGDEQHSDCRRQDRKRLLNHDDAFADASSVCVETEAGEKKDHKSTHLAPEEPLSLAASVSRYCQLVEGATDLSSSLPTTATMKNELEKDPKNRCHYCWTQLDSAGEADEDDARASNKRAPQRLSLGANAPRMVAETAPAVAINRHKFHQQYHNNTIACFRSSRQTGSGQRNYLPSRFEQRIETASLDCSDASPAAKISSAIGPRAKAKTKNSCSSSFARVSSMQRRQVTQFRLAKMSFYLILLWLISWTPIASLAMVNSIRDCHRASVTAIFLAHTMTKLGPTFDVFIYGISHPKIKSKFRQIVKWIFTFGKSATVGAIASGFNRSSFGISHKASSLGSGSARRALPVCKSSNPPKRSANEVPLLCRLVGRADARFEQNLERNKRSNNRNKTHYEQNSLSLYSIGTNESQTSFG